MSDSFNLSFEPTRDKLTLQTPNGQRADDIMALSDPRNRPGRSGRGFASIAPHTQH